MGDRAEDGAISRRAVLAGVGGALLAGLGGAGASGATSAPATSPAPGPAATVLTKVIPCTGERLPAVGMGTWRTFDASSLEASLAPRVEVLRRFFAGGGTLVDSSPMYGQSEAVLGQCLPRLAGRPPLFAATKVWTPLGFAGKKQVEHSETLWGIRRFDLEQIHNMLAWEEHLETLRELKALGRIRYLGITTSHGRRHEALEAAMRRIRFDFVQMSYSILDREVEARLLPLARERGAAVIVNRPFRTGELFDVVGNRPLPPWAAEIDCHNWAQLFLKFVVSHPAVTAAIPATSNPDHMSENIGALRGRLPDAAMRQRMIRHVESL
jgi:diketogulonate reductase-like aldo/keto reductase